MAEPNTDIIFAAKAPNYVDSLQKYETQQLANQQAKLINQQTEISNAKSLTELETARINAEKRKRQDEYDKWRANNAPKINPNTGTYDVNDYITSAIQSGHGEFALRDADELHSNQIKNAQSVQDLMKGHETAMETMAATLNQVPVKTPEDPAARQTAANSMAESYLKKYGFDPRRMYGDNWYDVINKRSQVTADNRNYNNAEGRDAKSQVSISLRNLINSQGGNIPDSVSAFEIISNPAYKQLYDQIDAGTRVAALKEAQKANVDINRIRNMVNTIDQSFKNGVKPAETVRKWIDMALNDEERAQRRQIVAELEGLGIKISETDSVAGAKDALTRRLNELEGQRTGAVGVARSRTISSATESQPEQPTSSQPQQNSTGGTRVRVKSTGEIILATPNQMKLVQDNPQHFEILDKPKTVKKSENKPVNIAKPEPVNRQATPANSRPYLAGPDVMYGD